MTEKEFKNLQVGDKVQIVSKRPNTYIDRWNPEMDKWLGKVMTIRMVCNDFVNMNEDKINGRLYSGWCWWPEMIEKKIEGSHTVVEHLIEWNKTIVKLSNGKVGIAKCSPDDDFDVYEGLRIATARAYGKEPFPKAEENPKNEPFKVGERIQFKTWEEMEKEFGVDAIGSIKCEYSFTPSMRYICGTYANIKKIDGKRVYLVDFSSKGQNGFIFSTDMIKHIDRTKKGVKNTHRAEVEE